jgi:uncharacterized protein
MEAAIAELPAEVATAVRAGILAGAGAARPVLCPLLNTETGSCRIYEARPIACREYGFYADRDSVLGCHRIELISKSNTDVVWGNHAGVIAKLASLGEPLGEPKPLSEWLRDSGAHSNPAGALSD